MQAFWNVKLEEFKKLQERYKARRAAANAYVGPSSSAVFDRDFGLSLLSGFLCLRPGGSIRGPDRIGGRGGITREMANCDIINGD